MALETIEPELQQRRTLNVRIETPTEDTESAGYVCGGDMTVEKALDKLQRVFFGMDVSDCEFKMLLGLGDEELELTRNHSERIFVDFMTQLEEHYILNETRDYQFGHFTVKFKILKPVHPTNLTEMETRLKDIMRRQQTTFDLSFDIGPVLRRAEQVKMDKIEKEVCVRNILNMILRHFW